MLIFFWFFFFTFLSFHIGKYFLKFCFLLLNITKIFKPCFRTIASPFTFYSVLWILTNVTAVSSIITICTSFNYEININNLYSVLSKIIQWIYLCSIRPWAWIPHPSPITYTPLSCNRGFNKPRTYIPL